MKYIILSPRKVAQRISDTNPNLDGVTSIEVTDEVATSVQAIMTAKEMPLYINGSFVSRKSLILSYKSVAWNENTSEWDVTELPISVPTEASMWAFREVVFIDDGLRPAYDAFMSALSGQDPATHERINNFIEYGNYVVRASPTLVSLAGALGKDSAYVDSVFIRAAKKAL